MNVTNSFINNDSRCVSKNYVQNNYYNYVNPDNNIFYPKLICATEVPVNYDNVNPNTLHIMNSNDLCETSEQVITYDTAKPNNVYSNACSKNNVNLDFIGISEINESPNSHNIEMSDDLHFSSRSPDQLLNCNAMNPHFTNSAVLNNGNVESCENRPRPTDNEECIDGSVISNIIDYENQCINKNYYVDNDDDTSESSSISNNNCDNPSRTTLSCMAINVGGLRSKLNFPSFLSFIKNYDAVVVTESKFSDTDSVNIDGYTAFYKNRSKFRRKSGGILLLIKDWLVPWVHIIENVKLKNKITDNQDRYIFVNYELSSRILFFTVDEHLLGKRVLFCGSYIEGDNSTYFNRHVYAELEENLLDINFENVCLLGDLNSRTGHLPDIIVNNDHSDVGLEFDDFKLLKRTSKDKQTNTMGYELISFCKSNQLAIVNGRLGEDQGVGDFTCKDASVVDYIIISYELFQFVVNFNIHPFNELFSDCHNAISIQFKLEQDSGEINGESDWEDVDNGNITTNEKQQKHVNWDKNMTDNYFCELNNEEIFQLGKKLDVLLESDKTVKQEDVNCIVAEFNSILLEAANKLKMIKIKRKNNYIPNRNKKCWYTKECKSKKKAYYKARKKSLFNTNNNYFREETKKAAKIYKREIRKCKRNFDLKVADEIRQLKCKDPKAYWNKLNMKNNVNKIQPTCSEFANMFKSLANETVSTNEDLSYTAQTINLGDNEEANNYLNDDITDEEVQIAINSLRNNKAYGIDLIINEFLVCSSGKCLDNFVKLFNLVLHTGIIPSEWCIGIIKPLFKNKGSPKDTNNYRGITILSCFGKLFTSVLNKRITNFVETYNILGLEQAGFRKNYSTSDHIFTLHGIIDILLAKKKRLYCAFLDYEKAFDKVDRVFLWHKLIEQNITGKILKVIQNIYMNAKSCVMVNNVPSEFFNVQCGVRQGENLSPLLFALFLNDMNDTIINDVPGLGTIIDVSVACNMSQSDISKLVNLSLLLYADDTVIFAENPNDLQDRLQKVELYCNKWKLKLNVNKCKIVIFSRGKVRKYPQFTAGAGGEIIEVVDSFSYLGLKLNHNNKMKVAQREIYDRASRAMFALLKKSSTLNLPVDVILDLFDKTIVPILTYGCEVWGFEQFEMLHKLQLRFYKIVFKLRMSTPSMIVFGETGHYPIWVTIKVRMLTFWFKLMSHSNKDKLSSCVYQLLYTLHMNETCENSYLKHIRSCLIEVGMYHLWLSQDVSNIKFNIFKSQITQRFKDLFLQEWYCQLDNESICMNYKLFKSSFAQEPFLNFLPSDCVIALVKFRSTNNQLPVNALRFKGIPRHERICTHCNLKEIGDEFHYLFTCPYYQTKRTELLPKYYCKYPNVIKYNELLNTTKRDVLLKLKHFICFINSSLK